MNMDGSKSLPDSARMSVLVSSILLAYTLTGFIALPPRELALDLPGVYFSVEINFSTMVSFLVFGLTAAGTDWLLHDHPRLGDQRLVIHWILPALTALVISVPLSQVSYGGIWWIGLSSGIGVLVLILIAEYISIDSSDIRQPLAAAMLSAASLALLLILVVSLRSTGIRLFLFLPVLGIGVWLVSLRVMNLRLPGEWIFYETALIAFVVAQIGAAMHYLPITPLAYGLGVLGVGYAMISLIGGLIEEKPIRQVILEPVIALVMAGSAAIIFG
jgi:hypothetical protein